MDVRPYVEKLGRDVTALARTDSEDTAATAAALESVIRRTLIDALIAAADEISRDLTPGSVELRLLGDEPTFAVTPPSPAGPSGAPAGTTARAGHPRGKRGRQHYVAWVR